MQSPEYAFHLLEILGTGAYGTVCVARPVDDDRQVVIKVLQPELLGDPDILARTRDEARLLQRLQHPNIVAVEALFEHRGCPVVIMEYIDGLDLDTVLGALKTGLSGPDALEIVRQVAQALDAAWSAPSGTGQPPLRVVHRDIRPSNVIVSTAGTVKVVDFGLARAEFDEREAHTDVMLYSAMAYMSPERFELQPADPAMDIYALGVLLIALLTGIVPVLPRSSLRHDAALASQLGKARARGLSDAVLADTVKVVCSMCAHDPLSRPTAGEVAHLLAPLVGACQPGPDLAAFGRKHIARLRNERGHTPPQSHDAWAHVAFLDEGSQLGAPPKLEPLPAGEQGPLSKLLTMILGNRR